MPRKPRKGWTEKKWKGSAFELISRSQSESTHRLLANTWVDPISLHEASATTATTEGRGIVVVVDTEAVDSVVVVMVEVVTVTDGPDRGHDRDLLTTAGIDTERIPWN